MKIMLTLLFLSLFIEAKNYTKTVEVQSFIQTLVSEKKLDQSYLEELFSDIEMYTMPLKMFRPKEKRNRTPEQIARLKKLYPKYGAWDRYSRLKINPSRVRQGVAFIDKYKKVFDDVEITYGVPKEYIAAIIGVETVYGSSVGTFKVLDNLVTLSFEKNRRNKFFKKQLKKFIYLADTQKFDIKEVKGSYAGAIGLGQFMPSNYEAYGVDYNSDGRITLQYPEDAIASIANYFHKNGWRTGEPVATRVRYKGNRFNALKTGYKITYNMDDLKGITLREPWNYKGKVRLIKLNRQTYDELWYGAKNFFVITRYNHSSYYAMSIHQLATKIKKSLDRRIP